MTIELAPKKRGRGPGKTPALTGTSLRLPKEVLSFYVDTYGRKMQAKMREVLAEYVKNQGVTND